MTSEWRIPRAALIGAAVGLVWGVLRTYVIDVDSVPPNQARLAGYFVGSAIGGAFLFALVAAVRNAIARRNSN
jgi:hypothetical protein